MKCVNCGRQRNSSKCHLITGALVHPDALNEWNGKRVNLVSGVRLVHDGQWHTESKPLQVAHLQTVQVFSEINVSNNFELNASGKTEIELLGEPKIQIKKFTNSTTLYKKEK